MATEYDDIVKGLATSDLQSSLYVGTKAAPDTEAKLQGLAERMKLPLSAVSANEAQVAAADRLRQINSEQALKDNPKLAQWMSDPKNSAVAHDDWDNLSRTEKWLTLGRRYLPNLPPVQAAAMTLQMAVNPSRAPRVYRDTVGSMVSGTLQSQGMRLSGAASVYGVAARSTDRLLTSLLPESVSKTMHDIPALPWWVDPQQILDRPGEFIKGLGALAAPPPEQQNLWTMSAQGFGQLADQIAMSIVAPWQIVPGFVFQGSDIMEDQSRGDLAPAPDPTLAEPEGRLKPGNLDPYKRAVLQNPDSTYSTTSSISIGTDDGEVLIPTVIDGKRYTTEGAIARFKATGENLGTFDTPEHADAYATALHNDQARHYSKTGRPLQEADFTGSSWRRDAAIIGSGAITAITEQWGLNVLLNRLPPQVKNRALRFLADTLMAGGLEALQETAENLGQNVLQKIATNPDTPIMQGVGMQAGAAAISAAMVRAMLGVKGYRQAQLTENFVTALAEDVNSSKLRERLPERYREVVDHYTKDGPIQQVFVPADKFVEYFQAQGMDVAQAEQATGARNVAEALASGSDVVIPMADFVTRVAPSDHLQGLMQDVRLQQDEMTPREAAEAEAHAKDIEKQITKAIEEAAKEGAPLSDAVQRVVGEVQAQLAERYDPKTAETMANVMRGVAVMATRANPNADPVEATKALWQTYGLTINPAANMGQPAQPGTMLDQRAFHGSPYRFNRFDLSKIGTGEGGAAFGWGIYLAERHGVAQTYARPSESDPESAPPNVVMNWLGLVGDYGRPSFTPGMDLSALLSQDLSFGYPWLHEGEGPLRKMLENPEDRALIDKFLELNADLPKRYTHEWDAAYSSVWSRANELAPQGALYQVDLPDGVEARMLDWDKPLSEQPEYVRNALKLEVVKETEPSDSKWLLNLNGQTINGYQTRKAALAEIEGMTGERLYKLSNPSQFQASQALKALGIPGIKYLDGGSRSKGSGTYNYVIFDQALLDEISGTLQTLFQGPRTDWLTVETAINPGEPMNPLSPFVAIEGIRGAQGRLTRAVERERTVGSPDNPRTEFRNDAGDVFAVGPITTQDWWARVQRNLTPEEITAARAWYGDLHRLMAQFFGEKDAPRYALAWLLSQQNESPSGGMRNVLRAADMARGLPEVKKAGLAQSKLIETLRGQLPKEGYDAKLLDFIDSELRRSTRTVMGDDVRGGQPAVIDVWANRDVGKIDNRVLQYISKTFGKEAAAALQLDGEGIGETDYEYGSRFYNLLTADLNQAAIDGGKWLPLEAQAVGWTAMQKQMGAKPEFPQDIFDKNTQRVSIGLAPGAGTDIAGKGEITPEGAWRVISGAAKLAGVQVRQATAASGAYLGESEGAIQADVLASPESLRDFADIVGHALRQTEVIISRPLKSGKTRGMTLLEVDGQTLGDPAKAEMFMAALREKLPEGSTIANGYQMVTVDGKPALRMFHGVWDDGAGRVNWQGSWKAKEQKAFEAAVHEVAQAQGIEVDGFADQFDVASEYNDWSANPDGEAYRASLVSRGRTALADGLSGDGELRLLPNEVRPSTGRGPSRLLGQRVDYSQENRGSLQISPDRKMRISLFESADLSTFLHETGHFYLEVLGDLAENPASSQQIKDDYATVLKWLGVKSRAEVEVKHHEKWARANEAYLMEGKAPSPELRGAFQRFSAWLKLIYKQVSALGVNVSDDVRGVFDRIYATDAEISKAEAEANLQSLFVDAETAGMSEAEFALYRQAIGEQSADAKETLQTQLMRTEKLKREAWWKAERAKVAEDVAAEYDNSQVVQTFERLTSPESTDRLNAAQLVERYGPEILRRLPRGFGKGKTAVYVDGGQDLDSTAEVMGYASADDMVQSLLVMPNRARFVRETADGRMMERYGDLLNSVAIADAAMEAIHGEQREKVLKIELRALRRKMKEVSPFTKMWADNAKADDQAAMAATETLPTQAFRNIARGIMGQKQVRDISPNSHLTAERKASRESFKAMAKGDYAEAHRLKQQELLNHYLYLEAVKAKAEAVKIVKDVNRYDKASIRERIAKAGADYLDQIDSIRERYEFKKVSQRELRKRESLAIWLQAREDAGEMVSVPESIQDESRRVNYQQVTMDELRAVRDALKNISHLALLKDKLIRKQKAIEFEGVRTELLDAIATSGMTSTGDMTRPSLVGEGLKTRAGASWRRFDAAHLKIEQLVEWLDNKRSNGPWAKYLFDLAADAQTAEYDLHAEITAKMQALSDSMPKGWVDSLTDRSDVRVTGFDKPLTRYDLISIAMNMGNAQNLQRLTDGYGWSENEFARIRAALTAEDWRFVQGTWDTIELLWPHMAAMEERTSGIAPPKVQAQEFEAAGQTWRGGYFPLAYDPRFSQAGEKQAKEGESVEQFMATGYGRASTNKGATKQRLETYKGKPLLDFGQVVSSHLAKVIKDVSHREAVLSMNKILTDPAIKAALIDKVGEPEYQAMRRWLQVLVNDRADSIHSASGFGKFVMQTRTNMAIVTMGWKFTTALSQFAGFGPSWDLVEGKHLGKAILQMTKHPAETWAMITAKSGELRNRANTIDRDMRDAIVRMQGKRGLRFDVQRTAFYFTALADRMVSAPTWLGAYNQAQAAGMSEEDSIRAGDRAVRLSQGGGGSKDLAAVQSNNELMKLLTMYYTPFNVLYARLRDTGHQSMTHGVGYLPKAAARMLALVILPAVLGELLVLRGPDDDEDAVWWAIRKSLLYPLAAVPVVRDMAGYIEAAMIKGAGDGVMRYAPGYKLTPVATAIEKIAKLPMKVAEAMTGDADPADAAWDIFETSGYIIGAPTAQVRITGEYLMNLLMGEAEVDNAEQILQDALFRRPRN